ncbi:MAG TPA: M48 family metallopeptidase [Bacillus bacterium]|nr:M48 family metallopeptidase [Bacillus sp. (in: firmicutes)]
MIHTYSGTTIRFEIKYKNRKSVGISIDGYGNIEVHAPKKTSDERVLQVLEDKWDLIQQKVNEMKDRLNGPQEKSYKNDESFLYLGNTFPIMVFQDINISQDHVVFEGGKLRIYVKQIDDEKIKLALKRFYSQQCKSLVEKSISAFQSNFKTKPGSIRITDSKTTWGTCDSKRHLTFNWRLVGKIIPDYKEKENWLALSNWKMTV